MVTGSQWVRFLMMCLLPMTLSACEDQERCHSDKYLHQFFVIAKSETPSSRVRDIAQTVNAEILSYPTAGSTQSYVLEIHDTDKYISISDEIVAVGNELRSFPEIEVAIWNQPFCAR